MSGFDLWLLESVVGLRNPVLTYLMQNITLLGSGVFAVVLCVSVYRFESDLAVLLFSSSLLSGIVAHTFKLVFMRPRPPVDALVTVSSYSFPSGHAALSFGLATVLSERSGYRVFYVLALLVGFSRVYLGVHYFSDVVVGGLLGYIVGRLTCSRLPEVLEADGINFIRNRA